MIRSDYERVDAGGRQALLTTLLAAARELHGPELRPSVERALDLVARVFRADAARVICFESDGSNTSEARCCVQWNGRHRGDGRPSDDTRSPDPVGGWVLPAERHQLQCTHADDRTSRAQQLLAERGVEATLYCPVTVRETLWGGVQLEQDIASGVRWSEEDARLLNHFAEQLTAVLEARGTSQLLKDTTDTDGSDGGAEPSAAGGTQADQLQRRVRAERALVEASKLLLSSEPFDMNELLRIVGEATQADYAYLITIRPEEGRGPAPLAPRDGTSRPPIDMDAYAHYEWYATGAIPRRSEPFSSTDEAARPNGVTFAVPILSAQHLLFGYLGIDFDDEAVPLQDEDVRVLNVLGDMLCAYLQRRIAHRALRASERRYRYFVGTISEAIWRVDFESAIATEHVPEKQREAILRDGTVAECNEELARLFGMDQPEKLIGWSVEQLIAFTGQRIVHDLVEAGYRLQNREYTVYNADREPRHFIVNTSGVVEDGQLISVWGSTTEVTERVELERRMVTALEQQQQHIGRDLHDSVGQLLTGVRMLAQNLEERYFEEEQPGYEQVRKIIGYADEAAKHVSDLQRGLMPVQMERGGLAQALQELAGNTDLLPGVDCIYVVDQKTDVQEREKKLQLYRIAQEATNNALKHAQPSYIKIALTTSRDTIVLTVEDDGMGFEVSQAVEESLGLHSMYYRARSINANLRVNSEPGNGTTVRCEVAHDELV